MDHDEHYRKYFSTRFTPWGIRKDLEDDRKSLVGLQETASRWASAFLLVILTAAVATVLKGLMADQGVVWFLLLVVKDLALVTVGLTLAASLLSRARVDFVKDKIRCLEGLEAEQGEGLRGKDS